MKRENETDDGDEELMRIALDELKADEKISTDMVAADFVQQNDIMPRDAKHLYLFDGTCFRQRAREDIEHLVFPMTPPALRDRLPYIMNNIITRTHVGPEVLYSAHCFAPDGSGDLLINCANGVLRYHIKSKKCMAIRYLEWVTGEGLRDGKSR